MWFLFGHDPDSMHIFCVRCTISKWMQRQVMWVHSCAETIEQNTNKPLRPGIEPGSSAWQAEILATILTENLFVVTGQNQMNPGRVEPRNWTQENQGTGTQRRGTKPRTRTQRPWEGHSLIKKPRRYSYELYWENSYKKGKRECTLYCYIYSNISFHHMISYPSIDPFDH